MEQPPVSAWQIISGFMGSAIPVALSTKVTVRKAIVYIFVGGVVSYYVAPVVSNMSHFDTPELKSFSGFFVGMIGVQLVHAVMTYFTSATIQRFFGKLLAKIGYGGSNDLSDTPKRD